MIIKKTIPFNLIHQIAPARINDGIKNMEFLLALKNNDIQMVINPLIRIY